MPHDSEQTATDRFEIGGQVTLQRSLETGGLVSRPARQIDPPPEELRRILDGLGKRGASVLSQAVRWKPSSWTSPSFQGATTVVAEVSTKAERSDELLIDRKAVLHLASTSTDRLIPFVASMIWGHGVRGYGPSRVATIIEEAGDQLHGRLDGIADASTAGAAKAWDAFTGEHKLAGLGPAFASKFGYFMAFADGVPDNPRPTLIVDLNTSWAMWHLVGLPRSVERRQGYLDYIDQAVRWAGDNRRPDEVELALFEIGKDVPRS